MWCLFLFFSTEKKNNNNNFFYIAEMRFRLELAVVVIASSLSQHFSNKIRHIMRDGKERWNKIEKTKQNRTDAHIIIELEWYIAIKSPFI